MNIHEKRAELRKLARADWYTALYALAYVLEDLTEDQLSRCIVATREFHLGTPESGLEQVIRERFLPRSGG